MRCCPGGVSWHGTVGQHALVFQAALSCKRAPSTLIRFDLQVCSSGCIRTSNVAPGRRVRFCVCRCTPRLLPAYNSAGSCGCITRPVLTAFPQPASLTPEWRYSSWSGMRPSPSRVKTLTSTQAACCTPWSAASPPQTALCHSRWTPCLTAPWPLGLLLWASPQQCTGESLAENLSAWDEAVCTVYEQCVHLGSHWFMCHLSS